MEWYRILPSALACTLGSSRPLATMRLNFAFLGIIVSLEWTIFADFPHWFCRQSHGIFCLTDFVLHLTVITPYLPDRIPELQNPCPKFWRQMSDIMQHEPEHNPHSSGTHMEQWSEYLQDKSLFEVIYGVLGLGGIIPVSRFSVFNSSI